MQKNTKLRLFFGLMFIISGCIILISSQRFPLYVDLTTTKNLAPSTFLNQQLKTISKPFSFTVFSSDALANELNLNLLNRWLTSISPHINISQYDPTMFPAKADHYDISTDGIIVIEYDGNRKDIDLIEQIILNEGHGLENIQNMISRALIQLVQSTPPEILLIHSNKTALLDNTDPMGLHSLKRIAEHNFINITETHVNDLVSLNKQYDLIIFYKLSENANDRIPILARLYEQVPSTIIFNHPKFSNVVNAIIPNEELQFSPGIIEDSNNHLIRSKNQLIVEYSSNHNQTFVGIFPFSSFIDFDATAGISSRANTDEDAYFDLGKDTIPGPFSIIAQTKNKKRTFINNYLITSNFWLTQGDNQLIIEDLIQSHLDPFPIISARDTRDDFIILTKVNVYKLGLILILFPILAIFLFSILFHSNASKNNSF